MKNFCAILFFVSILSNEVVQDLLIWHNIETNICDVSIEKEIEKELEDSKEDKSKSDYYPPLPFKLLSISNQALQSILPSARVLIAPHMEIHSPPPEESYTL